MNIETNDYPDYVIDIHRKGMFYAGFCRARIDKGSIVSMQLPDPSPEVTVFTARDLGKKNFVSVNQTRIPLLAAKQIHYFGEPVALVTAPTREQLKAAVESIVIEYQRADNLETVFSELNGETVLYKTEYNENRQPNEEDEEAFLMSSFNTPPQEHFYPDSQGVFVEYAPSKLKVIVSSEWPKHVKQTVVKMTEWEAAKVMVTVARSSPTFDGKIWQPSLLAALASFAAVTLKKSVKLSLPKRDDILYSGKRAPSLFFVSAGIGEDAKLKSIAYSFTYFCGSYFPFAREIVDTAEFGARSFYRSPEINVKGEACTHNSPPSDFFSGISLPQFFFASEMFMNRLAKSKGISPLELRLSNINHSFFREINREKRDVFPILLARLNNLTGFTRKYAAFEHMRKQESHSLPASELKGIGLATAFQGNGLNMSKGAFNPQVSMSYGADQTVKVIVTSIPGSKETRTIWKESVASILNLPIKNITLSYSFSENGQESGPSLMSGNISTINRLIKLCAEEIERERATKGNDQKITIQKRSSDLIARNRKKFLYTSATCGAAVVEIGIKMITMEVVIRKITMMIDCGFVNSEAIARQKMETAVIQSILWATRDQSFQALIKESLFCYPGIEQLPEIDIRFENSENGFEKGISEIPYSLIPAAFLSAIGQAVNKDLKNIPINNERIFNIGEAVK